MALSGHKDISMLKRYSHTREEAKRNAVQKLLTTLPNTKIDKSNIEETRFPLGNRASN